LSNLNFNHIIPSLLFTLSENRFFCFFDLQAAYPFFFEPIKKFSSYTSKYCLFDNKYFNILTMYGNKDNE